MRLEKECEQRSGSSREGVRVEKGASREGVRVDKECG